MSEGAFIVGTGRCGSTLLSSMLRTHPGLCSVSELFSFASDLGTLIAGVFPEGLVDGERFWAQLARAHPKQNLLLRHGLRMDEVLYRFEPGARFTAEGGVPAILQATLPHLAPAPDAAFDALGEAVRAFPPAPAPAQYRRMFEWLQARFGGSSWVERSGGSLRIVHRLVAGFPRARFVHLVRDGRDTAISMSAHYGFRMALIGLAMIELMGLDPYESEDRATEGDLTDELYALLPERFSREAFLAYDAPPTLCGHYWSGEIRAGVEVLRRLPPGQVLTLRYEDFLERPAESVRVLAGFLGAEVDEAWVQRCAGSVRAPRTRWQALPGAERRELEAACRPGFEALASLGLRWPG